jgi:hypothetical protein
MAEVRSAGIQFHATPSEIAEVLAQFRAAFACNVGVTTFPEETVKIYDVSKEINWEEIAKLASDIKNGVSVYLSAKSISPPPSSRYFLGYNLGSIVVDIGKMANLSLQESSIGCKSKSPDDLAFAKKAINLFTKITKTGAYAFKPGENEEFFYKNHRYSQGAKELYDKGYEIKPIAGSVRYKLP